jgi:tetratricopeptide (TPR) repeat protein
MSRSHRQIIHLIVLSFILAGIPTGAIGQTKKPAKPPATEFPPNPLELKTPDPLLPQAKRPLTDAEIKQLAIALDMLNAEAAAQLKAGDRAKAFEIWNRELRLRRVQGLLPEVQALGRVGGIAWQENQTLQVRIITQRLDAILAKLQPPANQSAAVTPSLTAEQITLLDALGLAYQQVRSPGVAATVYQQVLADARQRQDTAKVEATLLTLGQLYLVWFNYPQAAEAYRELLPVAQAKGDRPNEILYLKQLAYIYEQAKQPDQAILYQQQLVNLYQKLNQLEPIPALKVKIGDNYLLAAQPLLAEENYLAAYQLAQPLLQFGYAGDSLRKLGELYRQNDRPDAALKVYDFLIAVEQQAYNVYGTMAAYDEIGKIHLARKAYPQAAIAFQRGLELAKQLKHREDYFTKQIQQAQAPGK